MEGNDGGGFEAARDFVDRIVLGDLEDVEQVYDVTLGGVEGEAIGEDGEDEGVKNTAPVSIVKTADGVAKDAKATNG